MTMEKVLAGVYRLRLGEPEKWSYTRFREYPAQEWGEDCPCPYGEADVKWSVSARGLQVSLPLGSDVYGFGLQLKGFCHTGRRRVMRNNADAPSDNGESHAPVPFYVTTEGYGVFVDSARDVVFYCGSAQYSGIPQHHDQADVVDGRMVIEVPAAKGADIYLFAGTNMLDAVQKYNMFSGGGCEVPDWGLGVWYRMGSRATAADWVRQARQFRDDNIPVTVLGLEPGWQTHAYSCTFVYDQERLGDYQAAIREIKSLGYRLNLWEHCYVHPDSPIYEKLLPYSGDYPVWQGLVPDFACPQAQAIFGAQQRTLGADSFKLDECDGSDYTGCWSYPDFARFPSGLDGEQMHHLLGLLYQQTINKSHPRAYHSVRASSALAAPYPFVLYSDLYEHADFIRGMVNMGFSGLLWSPEVRHAASIPELIRRLQTVVFSPQALINGWYLEHPPWEQIDQEKNRLGIRMEEADAVKAMVRTLFEVRMRFVPYLQKMFTQYKNTGKPVFRALVLDYPEDLPCRQIDDAYLIGDDYLFAPLTAASDSRRVYLPGESWSFKGTVYGRGWHDFTCELDEYLLFQKCEKVVV